MFSFMDRIDGLGFLVFSFTIGTAFCGAVLWLYVIMTVIVIFWDNKYIDDKIQFLQLFFNFWGFRRFNVFGKIVELSKLHTVLGEKNSYLLSFSRKPQKITKMKIAVSRK